MAVALVSAIMLTGMVTLPSVEAFGRGSNTNEFSITEWTIPTAPVLIGTEVTLSAKFVDSAVGVTHTALFRWNWDESSEGNVDEATGIVWATHVYTTLGWNNIAIVVKNSNDDWAGATTGDAPGSRYDQNVYVYDPNGGFATGGGSVFMTENGAYTFDDSGNSFVHYGRANFGFEARYQNDASLPKGEAHFSFPAIDLGFKSTSYSSFWIDKSNGLVTLLGEGTVNGGTDPNGQNYKFMLMAQDNTYQPADEYDNFWIFIWWEDWSGGEHWVYQPGDCFVSGYGVVVHAK